MDECARDSVETSGFVPIIHLKRDGKVKNVFSLLILFSNFLLSHVVFIVVGFMTLNFSKK